MINIGVIINDFVIGWRIHQRTVSTRSWVGEEELSPGGGQPDAVGVSDADHPLQASREQEEGSQRYDSHFYAPGLKGLPGASSNRIVRLSVCLSACS